MSQRYAGGVITANQNANFSGLFTGSNSYLSFAGAAQYAIATSTTPFTVEAWVKPNAAGGLIFSEEYGAPNIVMSCSLAASNDVSQPTGLFPAFGWYNGSAWVTAAASTTPVVLNAWSHVAFVFTGATSKIYINGVDVTKSSSPTPSTTWGITATNGSNWFIGRRWDTAGSNVYFKGLINNFRFVNGSAVYTSNFVPPTNLTAITNTVMLTCNGPTFIDGSSYAATITNNGGVIVGTDNPFYTQSSPALGAATPGVWTLSQANTAAAQRSWNMYDPFFNLNTAVVHGNGTNGGTNNTFLDSSSNNFTVTRNGNTTQGTFTPFSRSTGYWGSFITNNSTGYLGVAGDTNLAFSTGDFTIELFLYLTALPNPNCMLYDARPSATDGAYPCLFVAVTTNVLTYYVNTASRITGTTPLVVGQWYHIVVSRVSSNTRVFLNGVQEGSTYADTTTYLNGASRPLIGNNGLNLNGFVFGYISNVRVLKGTGTTAPTVPTSPLTAITNTQLLTCQSNRFVDNSPNAYVITKFGDARTITYSPFYVPTAYLPQNNGGAMFFDGAGDYLSLTGSSNLAFGTSNFTIELFAYFISVTVEETLYDGRAVSTGSGPQPCIILNGTSTGKLSYYVSGATRILSDAALTSYQWYHIVLSRVSSVTRMFINGVAQAQTWSDTTTYTNPANRPIVGVYADTLNAGYMTGYISNLRVLNGTGVTSVTVPTAPLTAVTNTQLLLSGTNSSFIDNASNVVIETVNTSISTSQSKYGGSSMSFNGSSTYANINTPFGNGSNVVQTLGDFTVECWVNPTVVNVQQNIFYINGNTTSFSGCRLETQSTGAVQLLVSTSGSTHAINSSSTVTIPAGFWTHLAVVRAGPSFIVYFNGCPVITSTAVTITTSVIAGTISSIGAIYNSGWTSYFTGYISDFRATNYARYLGYFTPPTSTLQNQ